MGLKTCSAYTIMGYHHWFRVKNVFPHSNYHLGMGLKKEPKLFELFPDIKSQILSWAKNRNVKGFSIEKMQKYFSEKLFPRIVEELNETLSEGETFRRSF